MFMELWTGSVNESNHTRCFLLSYQKFMTQATFTKLHPNEWKQKSHYYRFLGNLDRCAGSCNAVNDLSNKVCFPNKVLDFNLCVFNIITGINKSKILAKHISCGCKCKFDGRMCNSNQKWNIDKCWWECKKHCICEKDYIWHLAACSCKNGKYSPSIIGGSVTTCDEIMDPQDKFCDNETNFNEKSNLQNTKFIYFAHLFLNYHCIIDCYCLLFLDKI